MSCTLAYVLHSGPWPVQWPMSYGVDHELHSGTWPAHDLDCDHERHSGLCSARWPTFTVPLTCTVAFVLHSAHDLYINPWPAQVAYVLHSGPWPVQCAVYSGPWPVQWPMTCTMAYMSCTVVNTVAHDKHGSLCPAQWPMSYTVAHELQSGPWHALPTLWPITYTVAHDSNIMQAPLLASETLWKSSNMFSS